jgi:hypothetical protein
VGIEEAVRFGDARDELHIARSLAGIAESCLQPDARILLRSAFDDKTEQRRGAQETRDTRFHC